jgi:D-sedoheptulose 7-phosphate isomerase
VPDAHLIEHIDCFQSLRADLDKIKACGLKLRQTVEGGGMIFICGNGGSAADAQHFAAEVVGRMQCERRPLAAVALTTDTSTLTAVANDYGYEAVFARQVEALARPDDALIGLSTSGNSPNVLSAMGVAQSKGLTTFALTGADGGKLSTVVANTIKVPSGNTQRIQEAHIFILHCWAAAIEQLALKSTPKADG